MKKHIDLIACVGNYKKLSSFKTVEEMNRTVRTYRDVISTSVKRADVRVRLISLLELLKRHSCKYVGVSFMSKNTIADKLEVSYKTIQRLVKKLEDLGMIKQYEMKRHKDMHQTANAIVILSSENNVSDKTPSNESEKCPTKTTSPSLKQKINNKRKAVVIFHNVNNQTEQANFVAHWVPERFSSLASCFYKKAETIQEFWKVVRQCNKVVNHVDGERAFSDKQELHIAITAFKEFVMKVKSGKKMNKGIFAYFNGIVNKLMDKFYFDSDFMGDYISQ